MLTVLDQEKHDIAHENELKQLFIDIVFLANGIAFMDYCKALLEDGVFDLN